ncbi:MAG: hypothetical protein HYT47_01970 [Candidatus Vogelbacteria bacterium]|nr:hypothetical protein [Candidatus Vogelbacteria bacterium]
MKEFFRFGFIGLIIGLGMGYALADWSNPPLPGAYSPVNWGLGRAHLLALIPRPCWMWTARSEFAVAARQLV